MATKGRILISGASFAGLATAFWMAKLGYSVTIVEVSAGLKRGGTPVNIEEGTIEIAKRMGLLDQIAANRIKTDLMEFKDADDVTARSMAFLNEEAQPEGYEVERDFLLHLMFAAVEPNVDVVFDESITAIEETEREVVVSFKRGGARAFDLLFGCDGIHSVVRALCFGEEANFVRFLEAYFSITIVDRLLIAADTTQLYNEPGRAVMVKTYNNKTDIVLCFSSEHELPYDYRDEAQQRAIIAEQFAASAWKTPALLAEVAKSKTFYFDKLCQVRMPSWSKGRVALVGDAAYCASPAAGRGGSLAIDGAAALGDAFAQFPNEFARAFQAYEEAFRPFIEDVQDKVVSFGVAFLIPRTEEAIRERNSQTPSYGG